MTSRKRHGVDPAMGADEREEIVSNEFFQDPRKYQQLMEKQQQQQRRRSPPNAAPSSSTMKATSPTPKKKQQAKRGATDNDDDDQHVAVGGEKWYMRTKVRTGICAVVILLIVVWAPLFALHVFKDKSANSGGPPDSIHWKRIKSVCITNPTLQAVVNPLFNKATSPVALTAWESLGALNVSLARFAAWFPMPMWSVAQQQPPTNLNSPSLCQANCNFDGMSSMLFPFMGS